MTDVALSDEQRLLVESSARLVDRAAVGSPPPGTRAPLDEGVWSALVDAGFVAMRAPSAAGGGDASAVDVALVVEQLARGPVAVPYLGTVLALELAGLVGEGGRQVVDAVVTGSRHGVVLDHDLGRFDAQGVALDAEPGDPVVGLRRTGETAEAVLTTAGSTLDSVDLTRPLATVPGAPSTVLGVVGDEAVIRLEAYVLTLLCADLLGAMHAALDGAVAHARDRVQFGRPIGSFQAVQHLCADALVSVESARSIVWQAAWAVDAEPPSVALESARVAKVYCSKVALEVVEAAIQVWGGQGITWECPAHLHQRRVLLSRRLFGDEHVHLGLIAGALSGSGSGGSGPGVA
jgi:alkylation response protein AidB-like acyl-CoA dehydrogenase